MISPEAFEAARPHLMAVAFRLLGSAHDAEDAVQSTWLRANGAAAVEVRNSAAWLTTVTTRVCLDHLRARRRRGEEPLSADLLPGEQVAADERYLQRERVSRALLVLLDALTPAQRVAYVLHDLFDVPFTDIAQTLGTSVASAKKHASRARHRVQSGIPERAARAADSAVIDAFLAAAAGGDMTAMIALMSKDCVRDADASLVPAGTPTSIIGARQIAEETTLFADRIRASVEVMLDGRPVRIIAPGGHPLACIDLDVRDGLVCRVGISRFRPGRD